MITLNLKNIGILLAAGLVASFLYDYGKTAYNKSQTAAPAATAKPATTTAAK